MFTFIVGVVVDVVFEWPEEMEEFDCHHPSSSQFPVHYRSRHKDRNQWRRPSWFLH
jgi:hypothetical protein